MTKSIHDPNGGQYVEYNPQYNEGYRDGVKAERERQKAILEALYNHPGFAESEASYDPKEPV